MKICMISNDFSFEPLGGRNVTLERIMRGVIKKYPRTEFHVITQKGRKRYERKDNIFSYRLEKFEKNAGEFARRLDKKIGFDIIQGFDIYPDGYLAVSVSSSLKKPCIAGIREVYILNIGRLILKYIAKNADHIVAVDKKSLELFKKITGRKENVISIRNSIEPFGVKGGKRKSKNFVIGSVAYLGDIREIKGWRYLLNAFRKIKKEIPSSKLVLIGSSDTGEKSKIKRLLKEMGLKRHVIVKGVMKHKKVLEAMQDFDVYISPSIFDGMPNVILEAMILKKPVIATRSGGVPEIIRDGYNGLLVNELSTDDIYRKAISLYRNREEMKRLGINAHNTVIKEFSPEREIESWYRLYKNVKG